MTNEGLQTQKGQGNKPPCGRHPRDDGCEYPDGPERSSRSRMKVLGDTLSWLEARLLQLEKPEISTPSVVLHDPYQAHNTQRPSTSPPVFHADSPTVFSPFSPTSTSSSLPSGRHWQNSSALDTNTESTGSSGSSSSNAARRHVAAPFLAIEVCYPFPTFVCLLTNFCPHEPSLGLLQSS